MQETRNQCFVTALLTPVAYSFTVGLQEITLSSTWEDSKQLFEDSEEYKEIGSESLAQETFEDYVVYLQEKAKEKERKREEEKVYIIDFY